MDNNRYDTSGYRSIEINDSSSLSSEQNQTSPITLEQQEVWSCLPSRYACRYFILFQQQQYRGFNHGIQLSLIFLTYSLQFRPKTARGHPAVMAPAKLRSGPALYHSSISSRPRGPSGVVVSWPGHTPPTLRTHQSTGLDHSHHMRSFKQSVVLSSFDFFLTF